MIEQEARAKAYFIAARLLEGINEHMPEVVKRSGEYLEISQSDLEAIRQEMKTSVVEHLRSQGQFHRYLAQKKARH